MDLIEKTNSNSRHPWELARLEVIKDLIDDKIYTYKNKNILDLGCGDLFFIKEFSKNKPTTNFYALDTAFDTNFIINNEEDHLKLSKSLIDLSAQNIVFDVIFLMDVIEHIEDDLTFLSDLVNSTMVDSQTLFIITVPAFQSLFSSHDYFLKHFRRYNNSTIEKLAGNSGLQTLEKGYFFFSLLFPRMIEVIIEKINGQKNEKNGTGLTHWSNNNFTTQSIKKILQLDYKAQKNLKKIGLQLPGLSNYIVCKKSA